MFKLLKRFFGSPIDEIIFASSPVIRRIKKSITRRAIVIVTTLLIKNHQKLTKGL